MPAPRYEDRYTAGGLTVRRGGRVISQDRSAPQPVPSQWSDAEQRWKPGEDRAVRATRPVRLERDEAGRLQPVPGEWEYTGPGPTGASRGPALSTTPAAPGQSHGPFYGVHGHGHSPYGTTDGDATHNHIHSHNGDANHDHDHVSPGGGHSDPNSGLGLGPGMLAAQEEEPMSGQNSRNPGGEAAAQAERDIADHGLLAVMSAYLTSQGINPARVHERAQTAERSRKERARARVRVCGDIANELRRAKRRLAYLERGWLSRPGVYSLAERNEAQERVTMLDAQLREAALNDEDLIREVKQRW